MSVQKAQVIRIVDEGYRILVPAEPYVIRLRERQPGSIVRDGEYGYRAS